MIYAYICNQCRHVALYGTRRLQRGEAYGMEVFYQVWGERPEDGTIIACGHCGEDPMRVADGSRCTMMDIKEWSGP